MAGFADPDDPDMIRIPFIFVPHGHPPPTEWLRDHPDAFHVPAVFVPRGEAEGFDIRLDPETDVQPEAGAGIVHASSTPRYLVARPPFGALGDDLERFWRYWTAPRWDSMPKWEDHPSIPDISESRPDRNDGLPPPLQALPERYHPNARVNEPIIAAKLKNYPMNVHHLIGVRAAHRFPDLLAAAVRMGWYMDEPNNLILLPATEDGQRELAKVGLLRPIHRGPHPAWSADVEERLQRIETNIDRDFAADHGPARDFSILLAIEALQARLRQEALRLPRIVEDDHPNPIQTG